MSEQTVLNTFNQQGLFVIPSRGGWTGKDRLHARDLGKDEDEIPDCFRLGNKDLLDPETRAKLMRPAGRVQSLMDRFGTPFLGVRGIHFIPDRNIITVRDGLVTIKNEMAATVECFLRGDGPFLVEENGFTVMRDYEAYRAWRISTFPVLSDAKWPTTDQIKNKFSLKWVAMQMQAAEASETDLDTLIEAKQAFNQELTQHYADWRDTILVEVKQAILDSCAVLREKVEHGDKITASSLKQPKAIIEKYLDIAHVFDLGEVKSKVQELKTLIDTTDTAGIRGDFQVAKQFAEALRNLGANIGDLSGLSEDGSVKRIVKKAA